MEPKEGSKDDKLNLSTLKHKQKSVKKHEEIRGEESSSPDAADSTDDCRKDKTRKNKDGSPAQEEATASDALESVQALVKPDKRLDKDYERKSREQRDLEMEKGWRRGKHSDSRHRGKPSKDAGRVDTDGYRYPGGSRASDSRSEKTRKRKGEDTERSSVEAQSLKTKNAEVPETRKSKSPSPFARKKPKTENKKERKTWPLTERDIWEGGIKVKPQKKISININLEGKGKEERTESTAGKTKAEIEKAGNGEDEKLNGGEIEESRDMEGVSEENIKPDEGEARQKWEKATFRDDQGEMLADIAGEKEEVGEEKDDGEKEDLDLWHSVLRGVEEEGEGMDASKGEEVTNEERRSESRGKEEQAMGELVADTRKERVEGGNTCKENRGNLPEEELMEGEKWRMRREEEDTTRTKSQRSRNESHHDGSNTTVDDGRSE